MLELIPEPYLSYLGVLGAIFVLLEVVVYPLLGPEAKTKFQMIKKIPVIGSIIEVLEQISKLGKKPE